MDSKKVHQADLAGQAGAGVGGEQGGLTPPGGGGESIPRLAKWLEETFCEVVNFCMKMEKNA